MDGNLIELVCHGKLGIQRYIDDLLVQSVARHIKGNTDLIRHNGEYMWYNKSAQEEGGAGYEAADVQRF